MRILVVDDEEDMHFLFRQKFRKEIRTSQLEFDSAFSSEEALVYLQSTVATSLVLILSDISMPGMSGLELLKNIKEKYPTIVVFMIQSFGRDRHQQLISSAQADDYISKPIKLDLIKTKILKLKEKLGEKNVC
ncbi:MAG: response regulator [Prochloraceae cyanobacterium]|nr:response regulator [Prochloraceae cyanobacterium]